MIQPRATARTWLAADLARLSFVLIWTSGPDPTLDGVVRLLARRRTAAGTWEEFDRWCDPLAGVEHTAPDHVHLAARFGRSPAELAGAADARTVWRELRAFLGDGPLVAQDSASLRTWCAHLAGGDPDLPPTIGLSELAALILPGRLAQRREDALAALVEPTAGPGSDAYAPSDLALAVDELAQRFLGLDEDVLRVAVQGFRRAWHGLSAEDPRAAATLDLALSLVARREEWSEHGVRGRVGVPLTALHDPEVPFEDLLDAQRPRCARDLDRWLALETLPPDLELAAPFHPADRTLLDQLFQEHLPKLLATRGGPPSYRRSQHEVARAVAGALGTRELLLVHAPTGTGKTLAYLVPAMLWARRHGVRVGIATYTRTLQEQAMDREVPRALEALSRAGVAPGTRVSVLKGRENYVCWRALKTALPGEDDDGATWLAWTMLALFALTDVEADLDRFPITAPLPLERRGEFTRTLQSHVRLARAGVACCAQSDERETCGAEAARARAQRSHVVIVNQAFALARQEFFKHVVFDECEHLHDQALSAFSHEVAFRDMTNVLARLSNTRRERSRAILDRVERLVLEGTPTHECVKQCFEAWLQASVAVAQLERTAQAFDAWRTDEARRREDRDLHSMLREYATSDGETELVLARKAFVKSWSALETVLAELAERIDALPVRGMARVRRGLERVRTDLALVLVAVHAWLPLEEGRPAFKPRTFYDVERDARGELVLASRVLLPSEFLGRNYYPELATGIFVSATTVLQDGFDAARAYLGLDRAAEPAEDEERPPSIVRTFRAPDVFDYSRVLVAVPRDAPPAAGDKTAFLDYVRRFVGHLAERTRGRMLVLFTNAQDTVRVGEELAGFFRARSIQLWFQNMEGSAKEELGELFRARVDSVLLGVDTFWYGADFPGETLEYLVIVKLPYGVPDRYHHAQCAALGVGQQRERIYLPRALAKFRQGFGRLMRRETDRGCVFILDGRVLEPRHRLFLKELPIERLFEFGRAKSPETGRARFVRADTDRCIREALGHMGLVDDVKRRGLDWGFDASPARARTTGPLVAGGDGPSADELAPDRTDASADDAGVAASAPPVARDVVLKPAPRREPPPILDVRVEDLPY